QHRSPQARSHTGRKRPWRPYRSRGRVSSGWPAPWRHPIRTSSASLALDILKFSSLFKAYRRLGRARMTRPDPAIATIADYANKVFVATINSPTPASRPSPAPASAAAPASVSLSPPRTRWRSPPPLVLALLHPRRVTAPPGD